MMTRIATSSMLFIVGVFINAASYAAAFDDFSRGIKDFDNDAIGNAIIDVYAEATANSDEFQAQWEAAEACRLHAAQLRETRLITNEDPEKRMKNKQLKLAKLGQVYAERALELASGDADIARAHRVLGELYSLQIKGMVSGMRNGPKAKKNIQKSLALVPDDSESLRSIGLMYLHNPPISGGDVPKAIETFSTCLASDTSSAQYALLLAMANKKKKKKDSARENAETARKLNPKNNNVKLFIQTLSED